MSNLDKGAIEFLVSKLEKHVTLVSLGIQTDNNRITTREIYQAV
jgi:hypothetical protein